MKCSVPSLMSIENGYLKIILGNDAIVYQLQVRILVSR